MSKTTTLMRHRYRPVSEFDEVTLASKREYWRNKKREQRARLSKAKKKVKPPNTGVCKPVRTDGNVSRMPHGGFSPTLLNNDGSYQTRAPQNQTKAVVICKKERESLTPEESNRSAPMVKVNGAPPLTKGLGVPAACPKVHTNSIAPRQTVNRSSAFKGNLSCITQPSHLAPKCIKQIPQVKCCISPKSLVFMESKFGKDQRSLARCGTNTNGIAGASVPVRSMVACKTAEVPMTEEEKAAKRRENWRIKKREQRAKRAEKLKMVREKLQAFGKGQQETGKFSCAAPAHPLSATNTMALRGAKQRNPVMSVGSRPGAGKASHYGVRVESDQLSPQRPYKSQPVVLKLPERQRLLAKNLCPVSVFSTSQFQDSRQSHTAVSSGVSLQPLRPTQAIAQSKMPQQKFVRIQRRRGILQGNETAEERLAKQREYWRIKKREQRAKRSLVSKGRLKDRDAFNWRAKRYQFIMEQMRKTPTGLQKAPQLNKNAIHNTSDPVSSFIKEDGTVTVTISQTTAEKIPPVISCSLSAMKSSMPSGPSMSPKLTRSRSRPVLYSIPNNANLSANQQRTRRSTGPNLTAFGPIDGSKLASGIEDAPILISSTTATQTGELAAEHRTTFKTESNSYDSCSDVTPGSIEATKQEPLYPSIDMLCSLTEQTRNKETTTNKESKSASTCPENNAEADSCTNSDSQSTTLLVVASMKKLLEESLSSVGDSNTASINEVEPLPCKTEDPAFLQEEKETDTKPDLTVPQEFSADSYSSVVVKLSPSPCRSPLRADDSTSDGAGLCQDSSLRVPCAAVCFSKGPADERRRSERPAGASATHLHRNDSIHGGGGGKISGPQQNFPPQARGGHQLNENSELQRKREYWRVMKRQQRARKAKELERGKEAWHPQQRKCGTSQVIHLPVAQKRTRADFHHPVHLPCVASRPARPVLSPTASPNQQPANEAKISNETSQVNKWQLHVQGNVPTSVTRPATVSSTPPSHGTPRMQTRGSSGSKIKSHPNQSVMAANKELDSDDVIQRKRMLWRIKKQEQRARKAARERELSHQTPLSQSRRSWPDNITHEIQCVPLQRLEYFPEECQTAAVKDEAEVYLPDDDDCSDEPLSEDKWRNTYLMDFDPVNQLLVCMVCGEQQYTFSVEDVRAHIEETHPGTLSLEEAERQRILVAWDEQVAVRERFFTNQLWQNSKVLKEESSRHMAEVEVILGQDDKVDRSK